MIDATMLWLLAWGVVVGLDLVSVAQVMVARPFAAGTIAGAIAGDPLAGALVGVTLELFALDTLPVGAARYPDYGPAAVASTATAVGAPGVLGLGPAVAVGLLVAYAGEFSLQVVRRLNSADAQRNREGLDAGVVPIIRRVHGRGLLRDAVRVLLVTAMGLLLAAAVRRWLPLDIRGAILVATVALGAALAVGATGALRLAGRRSGRAWLAAGFLAGAVWLVAR